MAVFGIFRQFVVSVGWFGVFRNIQTIREMRWGLALWLFCGIICSSVSKEVVTMRLQVNGFSSEGERLTSFYGEVDRCFVGVVVRGVLSFSGVEWASVVMWKNGGVHRHYWVQKDFSWRRVV